MHLKPLPIRVRAHLGCGKVLLLSLYPFRFTLREHQRKGCSVSSSTRSSGRWRCPPNLDHSDAEDGRFHRHRQRSPIERYDAVRTRRTVPRREAEDGQFSPSEIAPSNGMSQSAPADGTETQDRLHSANGANTRSYRLRRRRTLGCKAARTGLMMYPRLHDTDAIDAQGCGSNRGKLIPREGLRSQLLF